MVKKILRAIFPNRSQEASNLEAQKVKQLVRVIMTTRPDEIGCDDCFEELDRFVEMELDGKDPSEVMPLVQDHLERCPNCHEEFEALLTALRALS